MSKQPLQFLPTDDGMPTPQEMEEARARARRKLADELANRELGLASDKNLPVRKGPIPMPDEEMVSITLDLYEGSDRIILDGQPYLHGRTYRVGMRTYQMLTDIIARGHEHQREIEGKSRRNAYQRTRDVQVS